MAQQDVSRRKFLQMAAMAGAGVILGGCTKTVIQTVEVTKEVEKVVTQVVQETVIVEGKPKEVTKIVEKQITATPIPPVVTIHGRILEDAAPYDMQVYTEFPAENKHLDVARDIYNANSVLNKSVEPMLRRDQDQNLCPAVAESWTAGPKAAYWDFVIRKDCKWSDGTPLTADDWVFTGQHLCDPELDTPWIWFYYPIKGIQARKEGKIKAEEVGVEKIDDRTVRFHAEKGSAPQIPALLAYQAAVPTPKHKAEKDPSHWADNLEGFVGNGPWKLVEWTHNVRMWHDANEYYNGPWLPGFKSICGYIGGSFTWEQFLAQESPMGGVDQSTLKIIRADPKLNAMLHWYANFQSEYMSFNTMMAPLDNVKLRQALCHAIDKETLCYTVLGGTYTPAYAMLPPGFPAWNEEELKQYQNFDVEKAKALLAEAGYPDGKDASGKQLELTITHSGRDPKCEFVQQQWQDNLGIKVNYESVDGSVWGQRRAEHSMQIYKGPYEYDYIDPENMLTSLWRSTSEKGSPRHAYLSPKFDAALDAAAVEQDPDKRLELFKDAERILVGEDAAAAFLTHGLIFQIWWPWLTGIPADKTGNVVFRGLDVTVTQMYFRSDLAESKYKVPKK